MMHTLQTEKHHTTHHSQSVDILDFVCLCIGIKTFIVQYNYGFILHTSVEKVKIGTNHLSLNSPTLLLPHRLLDFSHVLLFQNKYTKNSLPSDCKPEGTASEMCQIHIIPPG